ncbi:g8371 [Coccomyxa viridis]|uniref:G8371 protein n=1 Tax=Coccomyxa viridis TaxID=1274662 RepID=A0ABP1G4Z8_9CHLO
MPKNMLSEKMYRCLIAGCTRKQGKVSRDQDTRQSCLDSSRGVSVKEAGSRDVPAKKAAKRVRRTPVETAARDCDDLPLADTRAYWLQRREALHLRLDRLYLKTGNAEIIDAAAASRRYVKQICSGQVRQDSKEMQALMEGLTVLCGRLVQAAHEGVVPGAWALMEQIRQCDNVLIYEGNGCNRSPYVQPAHEVDHSAIAALLAQSA